MDRLTCLAVGVLGVVAFATSLGFEVVDPRFVEWLLHDDWSIHFLGWHLYRTGPWDVPLGSTPLLLLVAAIHGTSHGFIFPAASALAFDLAPAGGRGKALAAFNTANLTGTAAGAIGFGWLAQFAGYRLGFGLIAVVLAGACALFRWRG